MELVAGRGERHAVGPASEVSCPNRSFELLDAWTDGCLGEPEVPGGLGERLQVWQPFGAHGHPVDERVFRRACQVLLCRGRYDGKEPPASRGGPGASMSGV